MSDSTKYLISQLILFLCKLMKENKKDIRYRECFGFLISEIFPIIPSILYQNGIHCGICISSWFF